jgi:hypothetical protein
MNAVASSNVPVVLVVLILVDKFDILKKEVSVLGSTS